MNNVRRREQVPLDSVAAPGPDRQHHSDVEPRLPAPVVANRVNATTQTIRDHYDKADEEARRQRQRRWMEKDRRNYVERLGLDEPDDHHDDDPETEDS